MSGGPEKALVFAAGLGTRMRPITLTLPKPLVRIGGKAMLDHTLDRLDEAGVREAIVNVHWLADQVEDHLRDRRAPRVKISDERELLLDQGGGIVKVLDEFGGKPFFICNTDALWIDEPEPQVARLARAWDGDKMDVLLLLAEIEDQPRRRGTRRFLPRRAGAAVAARAGRDRALCLYRRRDHEILAVRGLPAGAVPARAVLLRRRRSRPPVRTSAQRPLAACRRAGDDRAGGTGLRNGGRVIAPPRA